MKTIEKRIVIVGESGSDLPKDIAHKYGIEILPMHVVFDGKSYDDGHFPVSQIIDYYNNTKHIPTTSATNAGEYQELFHKIHKEYPNAIILHLCYSAITTATFQNANIASDGLDYVCHIDTKFVSGGQGFILMKVAQYMLEHPDDDLQSVKTYVNCLIQKTHMYFIPSQLDFLKAGGRVSNAAYLGANILGLKPMIEIVDGKLVATKKYRGRDMVKICKRMLKEILEQHDYDKSDIFLLYSIGLDEDIRKETDKIAKDAGFEKIHWIETGGVITTHCGPGGFGIVIKEK